MIQFILNLPLWQYIRSLGVLSYILLSVGIALGILHSFSYWSSNRKADLLELHTFTTNMGMFLGFLHGIITVIDPYMPFGWSEVFIPFTAQHSPVLNGLGTLAFYGLLLVILTSDFRHKLSRRLWHVTHMLSYPVFIMSSVHGFFLGTDSAKLWGMYLLSILTILTLTVIRFGVLRNAQRQAPTYN